MIVQVPLTAEGLVAYSTHVVLQMNVVVVFQAGFLAELSVACVACKSLFLGMNHSVNLQVRRRTEGFATILTGIVPLYVDHARMLGQMLLVTGVRVKLLPTY